MFKLARFLLFFLFLCVFSLSVQAKSLIIPKQIIKITSEEFSQISLKPPLKLDLSHIQESEININPEEWVSNVPSQQVKIYSGALFDKCKQELITLPKNAKMLKLTFGEQEGNEKEGKFVVVGNGFNSPVVLQALPLLESLVKENPKLTIYLTELYGQGLTHLELKDNKLVAPDLKTTPDPFAHYEEDMENAFDYLQQAHPNQQGTGIFFSSSAMSGLTAMQKHPDVLQKAILIGPYLGLSPFQKVLQWIGHRLVKDKLTADPFAKSWGSCEEPLDERLKTLEEAKAKGGIPAIYALIFSPEVCRLTSQILNPPLYWTNSANKHFEKLSKSLKQNRPQAEIVIMRGVNDTASQLDPLKRLRKLLPNAKFMPLEGEFHNLFINNPEAIAQEAL